MNNQVSQQHDSFEAGKAFLPLENWTILKITGKAQPFLHNFCTAHIKGMQPGEMLEAFILNEKGKTLGYGWASLIDDSILFLTSPGQFETLFEQLNRYNILEEVKLIDASVDYEVSFVDRSFAAAANWSIGDGWTKVSIGSATPMAIPAELWGTGYLILHEGGGLFGELKGAGFAQISVEAIDCRRILSGVPIFDRDISIENLPQEVQRDKHAIHFEKGCYLGQETVARIDAMGHVNKLLTPFLIGGPNLDTNEITDLELPRELIDAEKTVGKLTSVGFSVERQEWVGLGVVRKSSLGSELRIAGIEELSASMIR